MARTASLPISRSTTPSAVPAPAVSDRVPGRAATGPVHRLGQPAEGAGRPALVSSLSERENRSPRRTALDETLAKLELHVRRMPFDQPAKKLRSGQPHLPHYLRRDRCRLRSLPWAGSDHVAWAERKPGFERIDGKTKGLTVLLNERQKFNGRSIRYRVTPIVTSRAVPRGKFRSAPAVMRGAPSCPAITAMAR